MRLEAAMGHVWFAATPAALCTALRTYGISGGRRLIVFIDAPTTRDATFLSYIETARDVHTLAEGHATKFRLIAMVGRRWKLIAKVLEKIAILFPSWHAVVVQVARFSCQSRRKEPGYAVLAALPDELGADTPTEISIGRASPGHVTQQGCLLRCVSSDCPLRPGGAAALGPGASPLGEIDAEDQEKDAMAEMEAEIAQLKADAPQEEEGSTQVEEVGEEVKGKRDCKVELWPHAHTWQFQQEVLRKLGKLQPGSTVISMSPSAHPAIWLAAREAKSSAFVLTRRQSKHSQEHGKQIGRRQRHEMLQGAAPPAPSSTSEEPAPFQAIECPPPEGEQIVEAQEISQGPRWHEGLNRSLAGLDIDDLTDQMVSQELSAWNLGLTDAHPKHGRGVVTCVAQKEKEILCPATALFFEDRDQLCAVLQQHATLSTHFSDRIVRIPGVQHEGRKCEMYAILVGAAQFVNHYADIKSRHNVDLCFDASRGFNDGALHLKVHTRNGMGIAAGQQVVLNYGVGFNLEKVLYGSSHEPAGVLAAGSGHL